MSTELVYESRNSRILVQEDEDMGKHIVKILNDDYPSPKHVEQFFNEYEVLRDLDFPGIRKVYKWEKVHNKYTLYLEYFKGRTIRELTEAGQLSLMQKLQVAINVARAVGRIHDKNIIHKDITSGNILVDENSLDICIIDFGISTRLNLKKQHLGNPEKLEGTLNYISPEQTGRMNRVVDYRTDMYSLGVVLYELFSGVLPFEAEDPLRLVHAHIAVSPVALTKKVEQFPEVVSEIVAKLLEKNAEDRYQSSQGLVHDLERCKESLGKLGKITTFEIGKEDFSAKFQIIQKLYGRDHELKLLMEAFARAQEGTSELVLIGGYSGTGKSALAHEIHKPVTEKRGYFVEGKFDQYQRAVPYYAILQAFRSFIDLLLTENEHKLNYFKGLILDAVGEEGKVLMDVLPNLEFIIGQQPPVAEVGGSEAQNRFNYIFRRFVSAISTKMHPLVLFIDDLQWADSSSLDLLGILLTDPESKYFLCVCAYRDNEVSPTHPFMVAVDEMRQKEVDIFEITIGNLRPEHITALIVDSLKVSQGDAEVLTQLIFEKTGGNAFFVTEFLKSLNEEGLISFNYKRKAWEWDITRIKGHGLSDDVVKLMAGKILRLEENTQNALKLGSSIGNQFHLETLSVIYEKTAEETAQHLLPALSEGLILYSGETYKFAHDRIQQAVYSLIPEDQKNELHLRIGRLLLDKLSEEKLQDALFDVVNQLNWGKSILDDKTERERLAGLNLAAARKARQSSAFDVAFLYTQEGIELLAEKNWEEQYQLSYDLFAESAENAFLSNRLEKAYAYVDIILDKSSDLLERTKAYEIRILALKAENDLPAALKTGIQLLKELGEKFPSNPTMLHVVPDLLKTLALIRNKKDEDFVRLPVILDPVKTACLRVLASIAPSAYWAQPNIFPLIIFRILRISIRYGSHAISAFGFAAYGVIMVGAFGRIKTGYRFGKIGLAMLDKYHAKEWITQVYTPIYALIVLWNEHARNTLKPLLESYHIGLETGAIEFACVNANIYCIHAFLIGRPLERLEKETEGYSTRFEQFNQLTNHKYNEIYRQMMLNFLGRVEDVMVLKGDAYDEISGMAINLERKDRTGTFFVYFGRMILGVHFRDMEMAWENAVECRSLLDAVLAKFEVANLLFYEAISAAELFKHNPRDKRRSAWKKRVRKNVRQMRKWAKHAPENFKHKLLLMQAEYNRMMGNDHAARELYDSAIEAAAISEYLHEEGLANELAGRFYLEINHPRLADFYLRNAYQNYRDWGAQAKMDQLLSEFPRSISMLTKRGKVRSGSRTFESTAGITTTLEDDFNVLDFQTVMKASATISGEIVLDQLLVTLMSILSENLGATLGYLLLEDKHKFYIEAEVRNAEVSERIRQHIPIDDGELLPLSIISYISRTSEELVIDNVMEEERFNKDPYIQKHEPLSILVYPIINQGKRIGLLYFENDLTDSAFTGERFELLSLLSGQIAISLDNALLYDSLEQKVIERTQQLADEKKKSDSLLLNILPEATAEELKRHGKAIPRRFEEVTVMFTDFKDFTKISASMKAEDLVNEIGMYFAEFDRIVEKNNLEKIKTIGDSYMCAGGLPNPSKHHARDVIRAAMEIRDYMLEQKRQKEDQGLPHFAIRIGVHTGPVVAGVVGLRKFAYDIWGNTVNTASRMESACEPWQINISGPTKEIIEGEHESTYRGKVEVKNIGKIDMYYLN